VCGASSCCHGDGECALQKGAGGGAAAPTNPHEPVSALNQTHYTSDYTTDNRYRPALVSKGENQTLISLSLYLEG